MIEITNLDVNYKNNNIKSLKNINFKVIDPSIVLIVGESGSGKSTLAKAIMGILHNFYAINIKGSIRLEGVEYYDLEPGVLNKNNGFLPQYPADFTLNQLVIDEISFPLENLGFSRETIKNRVTDILEMLKITNLKNRLISELSSGELQKVALATSIAPKPKVLLLDEPFARIDSNTGLKLIEIIKNLRLSGLIILIFEHHLDYLLEVADRLIIMKKGEIISDDTPENTFNLLDQKLKPEIMKINIPGNKLKFYKYNDIYLNLKAFLNHT